MQSNAEISGRQTSICGPLSRTDNPRTNYDHKFLSSKDQKWTIIRFQKFIVDYRPQ